MRLLFDENLSRNLCDRLSDVFPNSEQVCVVGLEHVSDADVWEYAKRNGLTIVTKDSDYHQLSFLLGAPPKVVWLRLGNCSTALVERVLRKNSLAIFSFDADKDAAILVLEVV